MWAVYAGVLKPDVKEHPEAYYDRPFDVFTDYWDAGYYRLTSDWAKNHGPSKQMDWGSWLYITDKAGLEELAGPGDRTEQAPPAEEGAGETEWYGVLEVECY